MTDCEIYCELCRKYGHIAFVCSSTRTTTIDEAVNHWFSIILNQYQWNSARNVHKELFIEAHHIRRLSKGDFLYLLRTFIDHKNWVEFSKMYTREQFMYFYLAYKTREFISSPEYVRFNEESKLRIRADSNYWSNRAHLGQTRANELWFDDLNPPNISTRPSSTPNTICTNECAICLRDNLARGEMALFSCGHNFCAGCSHTMVMYMTPLKCPLCRADINQIIQYCNDGNFSIQTI